MIRNFVSVQFLTFAFVGGIAALLNWGARYVLSRWLSYSTAVFIAYMLGMTVAFLLNRTIVFPTSNRPVSKQARDFVLTNLAFLPVVWGAAMAINILLQRLGARAFSEEIAHAIALALPMLGTFLIYKFYAFKSE